MEQFFDLSKTELIIPTVIRENRMLSFSQRTETGKVDYWIWGSELQWFEVGLSKRGSRWDWARFTKFRVQEFMISILREAKVLKPGLDGKWVCQISKHFSRRSLV